MVKSARALAAIAAVSFGLGPTSVTAKPNSEAQRLIKLRDAERYSADYPGTRVDAGGARVHIAAPLSVVKKVLGDFNRYPVHIKKFKQARVVGKQGKQTDVYMQVEVLNGLGKVWAVVRFDPPKAKPSGEEVMIGHMVKGNVDRLDAVVKLNKIDDDNTQMNLELLMLPKIPLPASLITGELRYAADEAVMGFRNWSEEIAKEK
jgi:hypothetical protein